MLEACVQAMVRGGQDVAGPELDDLLGWVDAQAWSATTGRRRTRAGPGTDPPRTPGAGPGGSLPRPPLTVELDSELADPGQLVVFRRRLRRWTEMHRIGGDDAQAILIAVGEAVTNALKHGAPPVRVLGWTSDGLARVQVHDRGSRPIPATAGYQRPSATTATGWDHPPAR